SATSQAGPHGGGFGSGGFFWGVVPPRARRPPHWGGVCGRGVFFRGGRPAGGAPLSRGGRNFLGVSHPRVFFSHTLFLFFHLLLSRPSYLFSTVCLAYLLVSPLRSVSLFLFGTGFRLSVLGQFGRACATGIIQRHRRSPPDRRSDQYRQCASHGFKL